MRAASSSSSPIESWCSRRLQPALQQDTRGTVSLNCSLMFLHPDVVRYLFIHELAHTKHMNHSASFWRLVEKLEPNYRHLDRELLAGWRTVPGWVFKN